MSDQVAAACLLCGKVEVARQLIEGGLLPLELGQLGTRVADRGAQEFGAGRQPPSRDGRAGIEGGAGAGAEVLEALGATAAADGHRAPAADRHGRPGSGSRSRRKFLPRPAAAGRFDRDVREAWKC